MARKEEGGIWGLVAAAGAAGLFFLLWLVIGVPLEFSALAGALGYGALWFVLRGMKPRPDDAEVRLNTAFVDKDLAAKTVAEGRAAASELRGLLGGFAAGHPLSGRFKTLARLLDAIAADVEADPKDAPAAAAFLGFQGQAAARLARLTLDLEGRGASGGQIEALRARLAPTLDRLVKAFEQHLAHLQEDNLAEIQAELDVLENSLGLDDGFETELRAAAEAAGREGTGPEPRMPDPEALRRRGGGGGSSGGSGR